MPFISSTRSTCDMGELFFYITTTDLEYTKEKSDIFFVENVLLNNVYKPNLCRLILQKLKSDEYFKLLAFTRNKEYVDSMYEKIKTMNKIFIE